MIEGSSWLALRHMGIVEQMEGVVRCQDDAAKKVCVILRIYNDLADRV